MKNTWKAVHDCDGENGEPTCWSKEINHEKYGRFAWIEENEEGKFEVSVDKGVLADCRSLASAKRWVSINLT